MGVVRQEYVARQPIAINDRQNFKRKCNENMNIKHFHTA